METTISLVIVAMMLVTALTTFGASARVRQRMLDRDLSLPLAHGLMGEILQSHYEDLDEANRLFGPEADETTHRADFDDVDDYHDWLASPPETREGVDLTDFAPYTRSVRVEFVDPDDVDGAGSVDPLQDQGLKRITVEVSREGHSPVVVTALRSRPSSWDHEPTLEGTFVRWIGVTIQVGDGEPISSGVGVLNQRALGGSP